MLNVLHSQVCTLNLLSFCPGEKESLFDLDERLQAHELFSTK